MDQIHLMSVFVAVGELENFSAASRRLDISPAAVTRAVSELEKQLGARLLQRTTRNVSLTDAGIRYLEDCRNILASIMEANEAAAGVNTQLVGNLAVTAPVLFGKAFVMPSIVRFLGLYPDVNLSAFFLDPGPVFELVDGLRQPRRKPQRLRPAPARSHFPGRDRRDPRAGKPRNALYSVEVAATITTSISFSGEASCAPTVARGGVCPGVTHASHTSFICATCDMSDMKIWQDRMRDLSEPCSASNASIEASTWRVWPAMSWVTSLGTWPAR